MSLTNEPPALSTGQLSTTSSGSLSGETGRTRTKENRESERGFKRFSEVLGRYWGICIVERQQGDLSGNSCKRQTHVAIRALTCMQGDDPIIVWKQLISEPEAAALADFAILLLGIVVNQAGNERTFSDLKIKKTRLRNRLGIPKLEKMSKVCLYDVIDRY
jgi:hypothetical protein